MASVRHGCNCRGGRRSQIQPIRQLGPEESEPQRKTVCSGVGAPGWGGRGRGHEREGGREGRKERLCVGG